MNPDKMCGNVLPQYDSHGTACRVCLKIIKHSECFLILLLVAYSFILSVRWLPIQLIY